MDTRTIIELEADGFTHIEVRCRCGQITAMPFHLLRLRGAIAPTTLFSAVAARMVCSRCGVKPTIERVRPWHQYIDDPAGGGRY